MRKNSKQPEEKDHWTTLRTPYQLGVSVAEGVYIGVLEQMIKPSFIEPYQLEIGDRSPSYISALGKVILANLKLTEQQEAFASLFYYKLTQLSKNS